MNIAERLNDLARDCEYSSDPDEDCGIDALIGYKDALEELVHELAAKLPEPEPEAPAPILIRPASDEHDAVYGCPHEGCDSTTFQEYWSVPRWSKFSELWRENGELMGAPDYEIQGEGDAEGPGGVECAECCGPVSIGIA